MLLPPGSKPAEVVLWRAQSQEVERLSADVDEVLHVPDEAAPAADATEAQVSVEWRSHDVSGCPEDSAPGGEEGGVGAQPELLELVVAHAGEHPSLQESANKL